MRTIAWYSLFAWISLIVSLLYTAIVTPTLVIRYYNLYRDIEAVAHRAQVAADADAMILYLTTLQNNMVQHRMTEGHSALVFKSPANDLSELYDSIGRIIGSLEEIKDLPETDAAYQQGLDDKRGTVRELEDPSLGFLWVQNWILILLYFIWIWPTFHFYRFDFL